MKIAVIGSGIAGLASAIRLAVQGHDVEVFEKNSRPGGKIAELRHDGFRFDMGPSLLTLPQQIQDVFRAAGEQFDLDEHFFKLEETCRYFYPDGKQLTAFSDHDKFIKECGKQFGEEPEHLERYLKNSAKLYKLTADIFLFSSLHRLKSYLKWSVLWSFLQIQSLKFYKTMHSENKRLFKSPHLVQLFDRYATYNGSNPYQAPATLNIIAHLEHNLGAWFPKNGMYSIINVLYDLAQRTGVHFHFNTPVRKIETFHSKAIAIKLEQKTLSFDKIVSNTDAKYVATHMLPHPKKKLLQRLEPSSSALIFYWGVNKSFPQLGVHNILFSDNYKAEFDALFKEKTLYHDPTVYIFASSKIVPADAPDGAENWFVMINAPANNGQDWDALIQNARQDIKNKINATLKINVDDFIAFERIASPLTIEANTLSVDGALYGTSSNSMFSAFIRHPNFLRKIKNLYFAGGSVHPGGGIPLCLASAKIVAETIADEK